jgi:hypothetical protein
VRAASRLLTALGAALVIAACGAHTATKPDVIARGNAICSAALRDVRAVPPPTGAAAQAPYLKKVLPIVEREASSTRALPRPAQDRGLLNRYVAAVTTTEQRYRALEAAAARNDPATVSRVLAALRADPATTLAKRYGMTRCSAAAGTSVS